MDNGVRKNTLKLCFDAGTATPSHLEVLKFITGTLKLGVADLHSVYKDENDSHFYLKFFDDAKFTEFCNEALESYVFPFDNGTRIQVTLEMASRIFRYVRIFNLPPEIDDRTIAQVLGQFGMIRQHVRERYPQHFNLNIFNGVRGVHMEVAKEIPPSLFIGHFRARIYYDGLKNRCFFCKEEGHQKASCPKLAANLSGSKAPQSYSSITAVGKVPGPVLNVPPMAANMQVLGKTAEPTKTLASSPKESADPANQIRAYNPFVGEDGKQAGGSKGPRELHQLVEELVYEETEHMDTHTKQALKRTATINSISSSDPDEGVGTVPAEAESKEAELNETENCDDFRKPKSKRGRKGKQIKPLEEIATRSLSKPKQ